MQRGNYHSISQNHDQGHIVSQIHRAKMEGMRILAWNRIKEQKLIVDVEIRTIRKDMNEIEVVACNGSKKKLSLILKGHLGLNIYIPDLGMLFHSNLKEKDTSNIILLSLPKLAGFIERRKHLRLITTESLKFQSFFYKAKEKQPEQSLLFDKSIADISLGGMSIMLTLDESKYFRAGDKVKAMTICFGENRVEIDARVKTLVEMKPKAEIGLNYKAWKVSFEFISMCSTDKRLLQDFIFQNIDVAYEAS